MIYVTGDTHGFNKETRFNLNDRIDTFNSLYHPTKDDILIVVGDIGILWYQENHPLYNWQQEQIARIAAMPFTLLFIDGNHENFSMLEKLPKVWKFFNQVGKVADNIFHLLRGNIYVIESKTFFTFGGAPSIDRNSRIEGISWWKEEIPSYKEMTYGMERLTEVHNAVDYVLTHDCPMFIRKALGMDTLLAGSDSLTVSKYLQEIYDNNSFEKWFFGHYHENMDLSDNRSVMLFDKIVTLN